MSKDKYDGTNIDYNATKAQLLALQDEYQTRIDKIETDLENPPQELVEDWEDQAIVSRQNDTRRILLIEGREELTKVKNALSRLENGVYGQCTVCGKEIEKQRLDAMPSTNLCMQHAA